MIISIYTEKVFDKNQHALMIKVLERKSGENIVQHNKNYIYN